MQHNADLGTFTGNLNNRKRKLMKQRKDDWDPPSRLKKRPRPISGPMIVDLTNTDDDDCTFPPPRATSSNTLVSQNPRPKVKATPKLPISTPIPRPRPLNEPEFVHTKYNSETDVVTLCLEDIRPVHLDVLTINTRFLRQSLGNDVNANDLDPGYKSVNINNYTRQNGSRPCLWIAENPSSTTTMDSLEEVSVGGVIREWREETEVIEILSESDAVKENVLQKKNVPPVPTDLKNQHEKKPREPHIKPKHRHHPAGDDISRSSSTSKAPAPLALPDTTQYPKEPRHGQEQQPRKQMQTSGKDIHESSTIPVHISPPKDKLVPQHPKNPLESQLLHNVSSVRPPHSARSSVNGHTLGSVGSSGAMPSAKALGKRRAISPSTSISATTTPPHLPVLPYSADIQMTSHNSYTLFNGDFNSFVNDPTEISPAVQSSSAQANDGADSINTFSLSNSYHPLDALASLYDHPLDTFASLYDDQAASSSRIDMDNSRHTSSHYDSQLQSGSGSRDSFFSADFLYDDVELPGDQQHDEEPQQQQQQQQQQRYDTTVDSNGGGSAWSSSLENQPENQYTYATIDPTLLGGGALSGEAESEMGAAEIDAVGMEAGFDEQKDSDEVDVGLSNNESSSTDSSFQEAKTTYKKKQVSETYEYERKLPPRNRKKRVMPDMLSHDDIDLMTRRKNEAAAKKTNNIRLSTSSAPDSDRSEFDDDDDDDDESAEEEKPISVRKPISKFQPPRVSLKHPIERTISPPPVIDEKLTDSRAAKKKSEWQMGDVLSFCHQCRRKTYYAKMTCSDCQKKFCSRCYAFRCVLFLFIFFRTSEAEFFLCFMCISFFFFQVSRV